MAGQQTAKMPLVGRERLVSGWFEQATGVRRRRAVLPGIGEVAPVVRRYVERLGREEQARVPAGLVDVARSYDEVRANERLTDGAEDPDPLTGPRTVAFALLLIAVALAAFWLTSPSGVP